MAGMTARATARATVSALGPTKPELELELCAIKLPLEGVNAVLELRIHAPQSLDLLGECEELC